jgi:pimeloyl-ACP methyl ester carboxylesterase
MRAATATSVDDDPSDWDDINAVVDYIRALRRVDRVSLMAWSLGGLARRDTRRSIPPRSRNWFCSLRPTTAPPATAPAAGRRRSHEHAVARRVHRELTARWACSGQHDPAVSSVIWSEMVASDVVGRTWGTGVRRAPNTTTWGWNQAMVSKTQTPTLMVAGAHDKQVPPERVRQLYDDLGGKQKVFVDLACSSHNAMWEQNRLLLFRASLEWLQSGTVNGKSEGLLQVGY